MSEPDPYRYGPPAPQPAARFSGPTGKEILSSTWDLLKQDRAMIWLSLLGAASGVVAFLALFAPGFVVARLAGESSEVSGWIGAVLGGMLTSVVAIYFQAALVIGANVRADGGTPTFGGVLRQAWTLKWQIVQWAIVTTTVGLVVRLVEERLGVLGKIIGVLGGLAWAVASFFAVPVLVAGRLGPIEAVRESSRVIRTTWGTSLRTTLRFGVVQTLLLLLPMGLVFVGVMFLFAANGVVPALAVGAVLIVAGVLGFVGMSAIFGAITVYARALIYRYATGQPVPGLHPSLFAGAFVQKKRRWRRS
ncbi:DUF6159 family protein [Jatrophihabitans sp.]|uniref:DUF6159 family protein n=1 Tax=Jatrophihabitans sp. TaxID=1932789 RepID=UPI0030C6A039|nr:hypothetical protein [Jatrophihabitans sp.]